MSEERLRSALRAALEAEYRPAPALAARIRSAVRDAAPPRREWLRALAAVAVVALAAATIGLLLYGRQALSRPAPAIHPFTAPGPYTDPAAQVAWVRTAAGATGVGPDGRVVAAINGPSAGIDIYKVQRSPDGRRLVFFGGADVLVYDAGTGARLADIGRPAAGVGEDAFSPDSRYLAILTDGRPEHVQVIDLVQMRTVSDLALTGESDLYHGHLAFHPDAGSPELYVLTRVATAPHLSVVGFAKGTATLLSGGPVDMPTCGDPAPLTSHMLADGHTLAVFCHETNRLALVDTQRRQVTRALPAGSPNPFEMTPIYAPDGTRLYLRNSSGTVVVPVDLESGKVLVSVTVSVPASLAEQAGRLFVTPAEAGGIASTQPISPDGAYLYVATGQGLAVVSTRTLTTTRVLLYGHLVDEVWVSGDGTRLFAFADGHLNVLTPGRGAIVTPVAQSGFIASATG